MCGHYLVEPVACTPASGWEKGQVENQVGLVRERFFTPRLRFKSYAEMNAWLEDRCVARSKQATHPELKDRTVWEVFETADRPALIAYRGLYCSTKFAVEGLSEALNIELAPLGIHVTAIEPGYFRTDFLDADSLVTGKKIIADYQETSGEMRNLSKKANHTQPGDPRKLAEVIIDFVSTPNPPVRLPLGRDTVQAILAKNAGTVDLIEKWRSVAESTDFDPETMPD